MNDSDKFHADILKRNFMTSVVEQLEKIATAMEKQASALERLASQWEECDCQNDKQKEVQN